MLLYPALFQTNEEGLHVSFRDIPEALTAGVTYLQAFDIAHDALVNALNSYIERELPIPLPSKPLPGEVLINLPRAAEALVLSHNALCNKPTNA